MAKAASGPMAEAFRRGCALAGSKIDVELMISVFKRLGESKPPKPKKKSDLNLPRNKGPSVPEEVSVDTVVAEYKKGMETREHRVASTRDRAKLANYVRLGVGLAPEVLTARMRQREEMRARQGEPRRLTWTETWKRWVEEDEIVHFRYFGSWPAFLVYYCSLFVLFSSLALWKIFTDWMYNVKYVV